MTISLPTQEKLGPSPVSEWCLPLEAAALILGAATQYNPEFDNGVTELYPILDAGKVDRDGTFWTVRNDTKGRGLWVGRKPNFYTAKYAGDEPERLYSWPTIMGLRVVLGETENA